MDLSLLRQCRGTLVLVVGISIVSGLVSAGLVPGEALRLEAQGSWAANFARPWQLVTYMFVHPYWLNFVVNMAFLFWGGWLLEGRCGTRALLAVFGLGVVAGGLMFAGGTALLGLAGFNMSGASAGLFAVWTGYTFLGSLRRRIYVDLLVNPATFAVINVLLFVMHVWQNNSWGGLAHMGGLAAGLAAGPWLFRTALRRLIPAGDKSRSDYDEILDKARRSGYSSLSETERQLIFQNTRRK